MPPYGYTGLAAGIVAILASFWILVNMLMNIHWGKLIAQLIFWSWYKMSVDTTHVSLYQKRINIYFPFFIVMVMVVTHI